LFVNEFSSITLVLLPSLLHPSGSILWSRQGKLVPRDGVQSGYFGDKLALHDTTVVVSAKNDDVRRSVSPSHHAFTFVSI
jgi:hypothetical protein